MPNFHELSTGFTANPLPTFVALLCLVVAFVFALLLRAKDAQLKQVESQLALEQAESANERTKNERIQAELNAELRGCTRAIIEANGVVASVLKFKDEMVEQMARRKK